jgi:hypothetical protein
VLAAPVSATLVGRRLGLPILGAALLLSGALAVLAFGLGLAATVALLIVVGASRALLDVASRTLMQRSVPAQLLGRIFGCWRGSLWPGSRQAPCWCRRWYTWGAAGSRCSGSRPCCHWPPWWGRGLFGLDSGTRVPVVEIALLRSLPLFAELPAPPSRAWRAPSPRPWCRPGRC